MKISITAVTRSRQFSKALVRIAPSLRSLKDLANDIDTTHEDFDTLQVVFSDEEPGYIEHLGTSRGDRLYQIRMARPVLEFKQEFDQALATEVMLITMEAVKSTSLSDGTKQTVLERIGRFARGDQH